MCCTQIASVDQKQTSEEGEQHLFSAKNQALRKNSVAALAQKAKILLTITVQDREILSPTYLLLVTKVADWRSQLAKTYSVFHTITITCQFSNSNIGQLMTCKHLHHARRKRRYNRNMRCLTHDIR